jgi:soluble lytic murein transglycosylase-like protein
VCAPQWIADVIVAAADYYGVPRWAMMQIAACESAFDPGAYNPASGVSGLYQFQPATLQWIAPGANIWSASDNAYAAGRLISRGYAYMIDCAYRVGYL